MSCATFQFSRRENLGEGGEAKTWAKRKMTLDGNKGTKDEWNSDKFVPFYLNTTFFNIGVNELSRLLLYVCVFQCTFSILKKNNY